MQVPTRDRDTVRGDAPLVIAIAHPKGVLEDALHARREVAFAMIAHERATPTQQMCETRLVDRLVEAPIGRPAVTHHDTGEVRAKDRRGLIETRPG